MVDSLWTIAKKIRETRYSSQKDKEKGKNWKTGDRRTETEKKGRPRNKRKTRDESLCSDEGRRKKEKKLFANST